jgi:hypothetical protein
MKRTAAEISMRRVLLAVCLLVAGAVPALADPVQDNIAGAMKAYNAGDLRTAKQRLDMASQLIAQRNAQVLATVLPRPYQGWTADKPEVTGLGNVLGGMISAKRVYRGPAGQRVSLSIIGDSPMLTAFMALISNPQIAMMSGNQIVTIAGQQAMIGKNGEIQMAYGNRWFITVEGNAPVSQKQAYLTAINFRALQQLR